MSREILFRGIQKGCYRFVWGDLRQVEGDCSILDYDKLDDGITDIQRLYPLEFDVIPETVGQYTGIKDKNGVKIFEGDILRDIDYGILQCLYVFGSFVWYKEEGFYIKTMSYVPNIEIIGNIHYNPELLEASLE